MFYSHLTSSLEYLESKKIWNVLSHVEPIESIEPVALNLFAICCNLNGRGPGKLFQAAVDCGQWTF